MKIWHGSALYNLIARWIMRDHIMSLTTEEVITGTVEYRVEQNTSNIRCGRSTEIVSCTVEPDMF